MSDGLPDRIAEIARAASGRVGVAAAVLETGESVADQGDARFPMQSVYKLPIAMAVLRRVDAGRLHLETPVRIRPTDYVRPGQHSPVRDAHPKGAILPLRELLRLNVSESDGSACDVLLDQVGGPQAVMRQLRGWGIRDIRVANTEKEIGRDWRVQYQNWATPCAAVSLLHLLHEGRVLSADSRAQLLRWMTDTNTGPHRLKGLLPAGTVVAHKTGSSGTRNGQTAATNDIGLITLPNGHTLALAVFVSDSAASEDARESVIARIARAIWDAWAK